MKNNFNVIGIHNTGVLSSACLISNGNIKFASTEERFSRIKYDGSFPIQTINYILKSFKLNLDDINHFAVGWNPGENLSMRYRASFSNNFRYPGDLLSSVSNNILGKLDSTYTDSTSLNFLKDKKKVSIKFVNHHLAHVNLAASSSNFKNASILVADGWSENSTTSFYVKKNSKINLIKKFEFPQSLGCMYSAFTDFLGYKPLLDEWKVMGMAAYGKINNYKSKLKKIYFFDEKNLFNLDLKYFDFNNFDRKNWYSKKMIEIFGKPRKRNDKILKRHYDIAACAQFLFEIAMNSYLRFLKKSNKSENLILSGGCAMNCLYNGKIKDLNIYKNIYIPFAPDDSGNSLGAAIKVSEDYGVKLKSHKIDSFLGYEEKIDCQKKLRNYGIKFKTFNNLDKKIAFISEELNKDKVIAYFSGKAEFGQRALGNRSIFASPNNKNMKNIINSKIKFREKFRPFAPMIKEENLEKFFLTNSDKSKVKFMEKIYKFKTKYKNQFPAVVHKDRTGRLQTINKKDNPFLWKLLDRLENQFNIKLMINTSFNLNGEPIANSFDDALRTFYTSGLDILIINNHCITK